MGAGDLGQPIALWNSVAFDRPKRKLLEAAIKNISGETLFDKAKAAEEIDWVLKRCDELEEKRNNAIHAPLFLVSKVLLSEQALAALEIIARLGPGVLPPEGPKIVADQIFGNARSKNLVNADILREYRYCRDASIILRDYVVEIDLILVASGATWPKRPSLPNRGQKKKPQNRQRQAPKK